MTKEEKLRQKLLTNPASLKLSEIEKILLDAGFVKRQGKGSHVRFKHVSLGRRNNLTIPIHNVTTQTVYLSFLSSNRAKTK